MTEAGERGDQPFPLRRHFRRRILPLLAVFVIVLAGLTALGARQAMESVYLDLAQRRAETIASAVSAAAPQAWQALLSGRPAGSGAGDVTGALHKAFTTEAAELHLLKLKVYDLNRRTIYDTDPAGIGKVEAGAALKGVIERGAASAVAHVEPDGAQVYELYVPLLDAQGKVQVVFELYEPIDRLNAILARAAVAPLIVPGALMAALLAALWHLVGRAQGEIDARAAAMRELRRRIETFVSLSAKDAARGAGAGGAIPSRRVKLCLLHSDVRDFTGFAEDNPPEAVVGFLNRLMTIQVRAVRQRGGDVDKLIGDALLARFDGGDAGRSAVAAAQAILRQCAAADLPRRVGIGIHAGEVVSGAIGPEERRDFTVIGDGVNVAARLCAAAAAGEIVADAAIAEASGAAGFGAAETLRVKGRHEALSVRRWRAARDTA
jgi:class 3 adenylate cyclase